MSEYKIEKHGMYWHIMKAYHVGWWVFKRKVWLSEFPYYYYKGEAIEEFKKLINRNED